MLKWAVNGNHQRQQSHFKTAKSIENFENIVISNDDNSDFIHRKKSRRSISNTIDLPPAKRSMHKNIRSTSSASESEHIKIKLSNSNKENNLTSTPLPLGKQQQSPFRKLGSLKDLSTITPEKFLVTPLQTRLKTIQSNFENIIDTNCTNLINQTEIQYAPTLPTFDAEYSPCNVIPGPILALRGVGIADSYFEKPRYFANKFSDHEKTNNVLIDNKNLLNEFYDDGKIDVKKTTKISSKYYKNDDDSLSSSKMGDSTLNKMIDAILESARKERKPQKFSKPNMSTSTYARAEDPANDLNEFWDNKKLKYIPNDKKRRFQAIDDDPGGGDKIKFQNKSCILYNEREVCTPECGQKLDFIQDSSKNDIELSCYLKRQRAVRRKKRISLTSSVMNSAHKLFGHRKPIENICEVIEIKNNLSPDSGRNSDSDLDESNENLLKKKLLFSPVK